MRIRVQGLDFSGVAGWGLGVLSLRFAGLVVLVFAGLGFGGLAFKVYRCLGWWVRVQRFGFGG